MQLIIGILPNGGLFPFSLQKTKSEFLAIVISQLLPFHHCSGQSFEPISMKLSQIDCPNNIKDKFKSGSYSLKN